MSAAIIPLPITESRFLRDLEARDLKMREIAMLDERIKAFCRSYSDRQGFKVTLRPEQVRQELENRSYQGEGSRREKGAGR